MKYDIKHNGRGFVVYEITAPDAVMELFTKKGAKRRAQTLADLLNECTSLEHHEASHAVVRGRIIAANERRHALESADLAAKKKALSDATPAKAAHKRLRRRRVST